VSEAHLASDHGAIRSEARLPHVLADDEHRVRSRKFVLVEQRPPEERRHARDAEG
jgi:hypothetical protein